MMNKSDKIYQAFLTQKSNAGSRGIEWLLTFDEWLQIWQDSGCLHERGRTRSQYCMARFGDRGPYAVGNVSIITVHQNCYDNSIKGKGRLTEKGRLKIIQTHRNKLVSLETRRKQSLSHTGFKHTEEAKKKVSIANKGKVISLETRMKTSAALKGKPKSEEHRKKVAEQNRARAKPLSEETKRKLRLSATGRPQSEKTRLKRSESITAWHAERKLKNQINEQNRPHREA